MRNLFSISVCFLLLAACKTESTGGEISKKGVLIVNEGNFGWANGDLSVYNPETKEVVNEAFKSANGVLLGDVVQSAFIRDSLVYVVLNNSAKVEVLALKDLSRKFTINISGSSPRYFLPVNDSVALVTELYANKIWKINFKTGETIGSISVLGETNEMVQKNEHVFVAERTKFNGVFTAQIRVINTSTLQSNMTIPLSSEPNSLTLDNEGNLYVLTDSNAHAKAKLLKINTTTLSIAEQQEFESGQPRLLRSNGDKTLLYYTINSAVYKIPKNDLRLVSPFINTSSFMLYGMNINPKNGDIYVADVLDYTQRSRIFVYDASGNEKTNFAAGIIANSFWFY